jgi:hypothetical protein
MAEGATAMTLVAGEPDDFAIEDDVRGKADRLLAHPFDSLDGLEGERAAVDDDVVVDHVMYWVLRDSLTAFPFVQGLFPTILRGAKASGFPLYSYGFIGF